MPVYVGGQPVALYCGAQPVALYRGDRLIWPPPPPAVEPLTWVQFDGQTGIDTGIDQLGTPSVFCDFASTAFTNAQFYMVFGCRASTGNADAFLLVANTGSSRYVFQFGAAMQANTIGTLAVNTNRRTIQITGKTATMTVVANGNTGTVTATSAPPAKPGNIWLGCGADAGVPVAGSMFVGQVFAFQVSKGGALVCDLTPARVGDTVGMWDRVAGRLLTPAFGTLNGG